MNFDSKRGFVMLDALLGMTLFIAVALLCGYSRQFVHGFASNTAKMRQMALRYYSARGGVAQASGSATFEFSQNGACLAQYDVDDLNVLMILGVKNERYSEQEKNGQFVS